MNNFYKALDYFRKLYRSRKHISIVEDGKCYWLIEGYTVHKIPKNEMELNPAIFTPFDKDRLHKIIEKAEAGVNLKNTGLVKSVPFVKPIVPYISEGNNSFTIWFSKSLLNTFQPEIALKGVAPLEPAAVQDHGETIGLILPVRSSKDDITPFIG